MRKNYEKWLTILLFIYVTNPEKKKNPEILDRSKWWN